MKSPWSVSLALVAMSLLFFFSAIAPFVDGVLRGLGAPSSLTIPVSSVMWSPTLLALISLCGGIVFLVWTRGENPSWHLGVPLVVAYAIIACAPVAGGLFIIHDMNPPIYHPGVVCSLLSAYGTVLLPPCAALFFWSQRRAGWWAPVMTGIALAITLNALVLTFFVFSPYLVAAGLLPPAQPQYIDGQLVKSDGEGLLFLILHYTIGLPVLGICFLALAAHSWYTAHRAVPSPDKEATQ
ncbi:hypothetical protein [Methanoregula sp.]|uniref:hypothetical protein n=1 Tax=Methanoregula sp. TaxID=2052170 RepID=UPI002373F738|nr:hypothetical protein [Methanoregula sp.]MDD1686107.1 hypothetical protein [Methanoregula sp.]